RRNPQRPLLIRPGFGDPNPAGGLSPPRSVQGPRELQPLRWRQGLDPVDPSRPFPPVFLPPPPDCQALRRPRPPPESFDPMDRPRERDVGYLVPNARLASP